MSLPDTSRSGELGILLILSALMSFSSISTDLYLPALPTIAREFASPIGRVELSISTFLIGFSLGQLFWGPLGDRYGRRRPIAAGLVLFMVGSAGCALSSTIAHFLIWRVIQALGACAGPVLARAMVRDLYERERSAQMLSTLMLMMALAPLAGPLLGGQILTIASWRSLFWLLVAAGLLALAALRRLPETLPVGRRQRAALRNAMANDLGLIRDPRLIGYALAGGFYYAGCYAFIAGTPFAYVEYYGVPARLYGLFFALNVAGLMLANFANSRLVMRQGSDRLFRFASALAALAGLALALDAVSGWGGLAGLVLPIFVFMSLSGFIVANSVASALAAFPERAGAASSLVGALHYGSGVISVALLDAFADGTPAAMGLIVGASGLGCLLAACLQQRAPRRVSGAARSSR